MADDDEKVYEFEKPAWAKKNPLKKTEKGAAVKAGTNLATEITMINAKPEELNQKGIAFEKPKWTQDAGLGETGKDAKSGNLSAPVTNITSSAVVEEKGIGWQKPDWTKNAGLKATKKGEKLKTVGNLEKPITAAPHMKKGD